MSHLASPELYGHLDLVSVLQKTAGMLELELKVVFFGLGPHLDFLDLDHNLLLLGFVCLFALFLLLLISWDTCLLTYPVL